MTTEKIPSVQDTPTQQEPPLPSQKTPSIRPQRSSTEVIARSIVDVIIIGFAYLASRDKSISGDAFLIIVCALCGIRMSDIATIRRSSGNTDPPIAGGLTGGIVAVAGSILDLFRPHG